MAYTRILFCFHFIKQRIFSFLWLDNGSHPIRITMLMMMMTAEFLMYPSSCRIHTHTHTYLYMISNLYSCLLLLFFSRFCSIKYMSCHHHSRKKICIFFLLLFGYSATKRIFWFYFSVEFISNLLRILLLFTVWRIEKKNQQNKKIKAIWFTMQINNWISVENLVCFV